MATIYVDIISGNDSTGDGSSGNPYLTINKAVSIAGGPHVIRVAKTTAYTSVACAGAGVGWTNASLTVTTSADLRGSLAIGNYIGKTTMAGNGAEETVYRINGITATTITLEIKYGGTTATEASLNLLVPITTGGAGAPAGTLTVGTDLSGGWNLSTITQDGETWLKPLSTRTTTTAYGIKMILNGCSISKINVVEAYAGIQGTATTTATNCTSYGYIIGFFSVTVVDSCTAMHAVTNSALYGVTNALNSNIYGLNSWTVMGAATIATNNKFFGGTTGLIPFVGQTITGNTFSNFDYALKTVPSGFISKDNTFINCLYGIYTAPGIGILSQNDTYNNCTIGIQVFQSNNHQITNCSFNSCGKGIALDQYSGSVFLDECDFTTPTTFAVERNVSSGTVYSAGCTIDGASIAKAYAVTASPYVSRQYVLTGSFGLNGTVYGNGSVVQDSTNHRTSAPCLAISWVATSTTSNLEVKVVSAYVNSGVERTYTMWIKASNASWAGTITPKWKLNGVTIKTESDITSLTTSYAEHIWTCASGLITEDGELSLEFLPNMNNYSVYVDDFVVS